MKKIIIIFLLFFSSKVTAGRPIIDSLEQNVKTFILLKPSIGRDTLLISALWELTYYSTYFREENSKILLDSLEKISNRTNWQTGKGMFLIDKAFYTSNFLNDFPNALLLVLRAKEILKSTSSIKAQAYTNLRISSYFLWNLNNGNNSEKLSVEGIKIAQEMIDSGNKFKDFDIKCQGLIYSANHYNFKHDSTNAYKNLVQAEEIIQYHRVRYLAENVLYGTFGTYYSYTNQPQKAFEYWKKCLEIAAPQKDFYTLTSMNRLKSEYYWQYAAKKNLNLALKYAYESYKYAQNLGILQFVTLAEKNLYAINRLKGNQLEALKYLEFFKFHEDSLSKERIQKTYADYDFLKKETRIKSLENERLQTKINLQKLIRNLLIISLLAGIGFLFYFFRNNQKLTTKNQEIEEALLKGQTIERKRVATELHDNLSAKLSGIRWRLEAVKPNFETKKEQNIYQKSILTLAEAYTDVRLIAHNLLPDELETKGLNTAVTKLIEELNSLGKTQFNIIFSGNTERYSKKIEYEVYSLILELSSNIMKHSEAIKAQINLNRTENYLLLKVSDNGIGLPKFSQNKGMGIDNLKSRVESLHGIIQFVDKGGLEVIIDIPLKKHQ